VRRGFFPLLALLLLLPSVALAQGAADYQTGPPLPLVGVPLDFRCAAEIGPGHPLLSRQTGQDLHDLARSDHGDVDLASWLSDHLCGLIWTELAAAGAHPSPTDVHLPARAVLAITLVDAELEGTRTVEQRVGSTVMPVAVPHWALQLRWKVRFAIEYDSEGAVVVRTTPLELNRSAAAEQDDYTPLRLGALLRASTRGSFRELPRILADEGRLGDLLFAIVDRPPNAPTELGVTGRLDDGFWNLLVPRAEHRHDALAFYLSSPRAPLQGRVELAQWFVLNDSDLAVRRDGLAWLMQQEPAPGNDAPISEETRRLLRWLLTRDKSPRMRAEVATTLIGRTGDAVRDLLLVASSDSDRRVSDIANTALRHFQPPTALEMEALDLVSPPPRPAKWTAALDGRVALPAGNPDRFLLVLATAAGGPAAETWTARWLRHGGLTDDDAEWAVQAWGALAAHPSLRVRRETLERLSREIDVVEVEAVLIDRILAEEDPELRIMAIKALDRGDGPGTAGALLEASRDDDAGVRAAAALALGQVPGTEARGRLEVLVRSDPDGKVRRKARRALRQWQRSLGS